MWLGGHGQPWVNLLSLAQEPSLQTFTRVSSETFSSTAAPGRAFPGGLEVSCVGSFEGGYVVIWVLETMVPRFHRPLGWCLKRTALSFLNPTSWLNELCPLCQQPSPADGRQLHLQRGLPLAEVRRGSEAGCCGQWIGGGFVLPREGGWS